ncbi:MAG: hypothetical protein H0V01_00025 [Bacteroidetes bacterium]|nr:hypothetical protein [Bacteroidota bacterium]HET6243459.1 hypothetical protein [Bacteroidia bacterium]
MQRDENHSLANLILPEGILEFFKIAKIDPLEKSYHIHLEEKNTIPEEYSHHKLTSKGFYDEMTIQDFPSNELLSFLLLLY